jgi:hypothetical protein
MNERFKELKTQATEDILGVKLLNEEYFARLIVEECAKIVESQDVDPAFKHRMSWAIKEHLGFNNG